MKIVFTIIGLIVLAIVIFAVYRFITVKRQNNKLNAERFDRLKELYDKLESGQEITENDVLPFAKNILTRQTAFQLLADHDKTNLFPKEFNNLISGAESNLANWLEFPTELDACPDEIEHIKRVTFDFDGQNNFVHYEVFKCRVNEPHWSAKDGWFLGIVGPYFDNSKPYDFPHATFSRISSTLDKVTPEEEAKWVHDNISNRQ
ncbi:FeoB-associated Cys-rich membrane protein [Hymenobacter siberiensis]|jgi:diadenosine tetraphosphatase ApaH/serine/threonine PP2A family protein phosphatase|uniref:FeoB-associated Cys-rich membrane protein n=1 Tax=Hymenobacter siberiensis TaxID=2848396 RepID=UPI001C1E4B25|nr:FeoB-associated Cys-rich membrane protein [Hymenobacter siberiensis]MBU6121270.1 FeoB-associated Cys-rich membrane protein [Hymenobacter siberiensis]